MEKVPMRHLLLLLAAAALPACTASAPPPAAVSPAVFAQDAPAAEEEPAPIVPAALMPKQETGVDRFLEEHPQYDGRGVTVAIFDTGVDPGALGLQTTPQGEPKIVDIVDATGSGDVQTSTVVELGDDGTLTGLSGRTLTPDPAWNNPSGEYRLGLKAGYELFPGGLVARLKRERKEDFAEAQRLAVAEARRAMVEFDAAHEGDDLDEAAEKKRQSLQARLDELQAMWGAYDDPGPIFDCLVFHDGEVWRGAVDTDEDGDFADEKAMTDYRSEREYGTFGEEDLLNFVLNIYDEGNILSIVVDSGAHGTHVAGIVAAYRPDQPELNGMAPGAQIVSVKIGDTRLGSMSVNTGEIRGYRTVLDNDCDLINMSYGGSSAYPDSGRIDTLLSEIVNEHGVIFVASAGNSGPALSTIGSPGGTVEAILGVGAVLSPEMMRAQYSVREPYEDVNYTWTSNGPTLDGALGVAIAAPGGAVSPVPTWSLQQNMLMNGTSMAAPNACGGLALLLSGLKAQERDYSPYSVRRAIQNTAQVIPGVDVWAQGPGMLQVDRAWDYLIEHDDVIDEEVRYEVSIEEREGGRGVYLREPFETDEPALVRVTVKPQFPEETPSTDKVDYEMQFRLQPTSPWVTVSDSMRLTHGGSRFRVHIDPTDLEPGVHFAQVLGYDALAEEKGPIFRVPVTVVRPEPVVEDDDWTFERIIDTRAGRIERLLLDVPDGATWADIHITRLDEETNRLLVLQTLQLLDERPFDDHYQTHYIYFEDEQRELRSIPVEGGGTLEIAAAQYWSSLGTGEFLIEASFHGLRPGSSTFVLDGASTVQPLDMTATLDRRQIAPSGKLTRLRRTLGPVDSTIEPLPGEREVLPDNRRTYQMVSDYEFSLDEAATVHFRPGASDLPHVWDLFESQIYMVFDANKQLVGVASGNEESLKLDKGDYTVRYHLRHNEPGELEKAQDLALALEIELPKALGVSFHGSPDAAHNGRGDSAGGTLEAGQHRRVYAHVPRRDAAPDNLHDGDVLVGSFTLGTRAGAEAGSGHRPGGYPLIYLPAAKSQIEKKKAATDEAPADEELSEEEQARDERLEDLREQIDEDGDAEAIEAEFAALLEEWPDHLPLLELRLAWLEDREDAADDAVLDAARAIIESIDRTELAAYFGLNHVEETPEAKRLHTKRQAQRQALIEALRVRAELLQERVDSPGNEEAFAAYEDALIELKEWADWSDCCFDLRLADALLREWRGQALAMLNERIKTHPVKRELYDERLELLEKMDYAHWAAYEKRWLLRRFVDEYPLF
jgi:tripeptidyl-peptidase-2